MASGASRAAADALRPPRADVWSSHVLERALAVGTIATLPLVSVPFLPFVSVTAIAPIVVLFAGPLVLLDIVRYARGFRFARTGVALAAVLGALLALSWLPMALDPSAYSSSAVLIQSRIVRALLPLVSAIVVYLAFRAIALRPGLGPRFMVRVLAGVAGTYAVVAVMALATVVQVPFVTDAYRWLRNVFTTSGDAPIGGLRRVAALAYEPSFAGFEYVGWWIPIALAMGVARRRRSWATMGFVFVIAAVGTRSLTAAIGLVVLGAIAGFVLLRRVRRPEVRLLLIAVAALVVGSAAFAPPVGAILGRLLVQAPDLASGAILERGPRDPSLSERAALLHSAVNVALAYPLTGAGFGVAGYRFIDHRPAWTYANPYTGTYVGYLENPDGRVFPSAKNLYVRVWSETGPWSLLALLAIIAIGLQRGVRAARAATASPEARALGLAAALGVVASAVGYVSLDSFGVPYLWAWLGLLAGLRVE